MNTAAAVMDPSQYTYDMVADQFNELWKDDSVNTLFHKARTDKGSRHLLDLVVYRFCAITAETHKQDMKYFVHSGFETDDMKHTIFVTYCKYFDTIANSDSPKFYLLRVSANARVKISQDEGTLLGSITKGSSSKRPLMQQAMQGERVTSGNQTVDYVLNTIVANEKNTTSMNKIIPSDTYSSEGIEFSETIQDDNKEQERLDWETLYAANEMIYELPDPMMRLVYSVRYFDPSNDQFATTSNKIRNSIKICRERYGITEDEFYIALNGAENIMKWNYSREAM